MKKGKEVATFKLKEGSDYLVGIVSI